LIDALTVLALALALTHFSFPLLYYLYLRSRWLNRDWGVGRVPWLCAEGVNNYSNL
jgi:hypothetical protein